jgi:hypothetical protein
MVMSGFGTAAGRDDAYGRGLLLRADRPGAGLVEVVALARGGLLGLQGWW